MAVKTPILVTGGAGYVGSHACKALAQAGFAPIAYDNLVYGHRWAVKWGALEEGDVTNKARLAEVIERYRPVAVMHFAAYTYVGESVTDPGKYYHNNIGGTLSLLELMCEYGIRRIVFSSTCATYGMPESVPIAEDHPQRPINPYGTSKLTVEQMLRDFAVAHDIRSVSLRYFNAAGADPNGEIGEVHRPETHLIPRALDAALERRPHVKIFGDAYPTPDGTCVRDYIHVSDLAEAHLLALRHLESADGALAYNLGNGRGFSVREVIETVRRVTGRKVAAPISPPRPGDPPVLVADARRVEKELGWKPQYADLDIQVAHAWNWHQAYFGHMGTREERTE